MLPFNLSSREALAPEIAICDLDLLQILIPTDKQWSRYHPSHTRKSRWPWPKRTRLFRDRGWACYQGQIIGNITGLQLDSLVPSRSGPTRQTLKLGQPVSFALSCQGPIPEAIAWRALFQYQFNPDPILHYALFQHLIPQFIRIYPLRSTASLNTLIQKFLTEKKTVFKSR